MSSLSISTSSDEATVVCALFIDFFGDPEGSIVRCHRRKDSNREWSLGLRRSQRRQRLTSSQGGENRSVSLSRFIIIIIDGSLRLQESLGLGESSQESSLRSKKV